MKVYDIPERYRSVGVSYTLALMEPDESWEYIVDADGEEYRYEMPDEASKAFDDVLVNGTPDIDPDEFGEAKLVLFKESMEILRRSK